MRYRRRDVPAVGARSGADTCVALGRGVSLVDALTFGGIRDMVPAAAFDRLWTLDDPPRILRREYMFCPDVKVYWRPDGTMYAWWRGPVSYPDVAALVAAHGLTLHPEAVGHRRSGDMQFEAELSGAWIEPTSLLKGAT
jgi:hypothetical protein